MTIVIIHFVPFESSETESENNTERKTLLRPKSLRSLSIADFGRLGFDDGIVIFDDH